MEEIENSELCFQASYTCDKEFTEAVGRLLYRKGSLRSFFRYFLPTVLALCTAVLFRMGNVSFLSILYAVLSVAVFLFLALAPKLIAHTIRKRNKGRESAVQSFYEDSIVGVTALEKGIRSYRSITVFTETDDLFALFPAKNVVIAIPKTTLEPADNAAFCKFIEEKTGLRHNYYPCKKKPLALRLLPALFALLLLAVSAAVPMIQSGTPNVFSGDSGYSITLDASFTSYDSEGCVFSAWSDRVDCYAYFDAGDYASARVYLEAYADYYGIPESGRTLQPLANGAMALSFQDGDVHCLVAAIPDGFAFCVTEFVCAESDFARYQQRMLDWAESISISQNTGI